MVERCFGKPPGVYIARKIRSIPEGRRGCFVKVKSWFHDEVVQTAVHEWIAEHPADQITACGLSGTARRWLNPLGLVHSRYTKDVYVGEHEREDAVFIARGVSCLAGIL